MNRIYINEKVALDAAELSFTFARSGGPGGQNVNKVCSKAVLRWYPAASSLPYDVKARFLSRYASRLTTGGEMVIASQRFASQGSNQQDCIDKLRELILSVSEPPQLRRATRPTYSSVQDRLQSKGKTSSKKQNRSKRISLDD